jgi:hypothetical protein
MPIASQSRIKKKCLKETGLGDIEWIALAQDRDQWRALVNTGINLRAPENIWKFFSG